ncbi:MAG TPA: hypothetical protein VMF06_24200 [Candidatus Limnocylindria bacterium]|nr:hypothetical protein [Candidatus Limnocylindria bacterium]
MGRFLNDQASPAFNGWMLPESPLLPTLPRVPILAIAVLAWSGVSSVCATAEEKFALYKSTDGGASWSVAGQGLPTDARINALSSTGHVLLAGTDRGIFTSQDSGITWHTVSTNDQEFRVLCFANVHEQSFAGTQNRGVLASDDHGQTWHAVNSGLTDLWIRSLLGVGAKLYAGTDGQGVFVSEKQHRWTRQAAGLPETSQVFDLAELNTTIYAGLYTKGLYRWDTGHQSWIKTGHVSPLEMVAAGGSLVVGHNPGGIFFSGDEGKSWLDGNQGLPESTPVWTLAAGEGRVLLGTTGKLGPLQDDVSLFSSVDGGKSWMRSDAGIPASSAAISFYLDKDFLLVGLVLHGGAPILPSL